MGIAKATAEIPIQRRGMSRSSRLVNAADPQRPVEAMAPRTEASSDSRIEESVYTAETNMVPTAIGRTTLNQTFLLIASQGTGAPAGTPNRRGKSGSMKSTNGISTHHANTVPEKLMAAKRGPTM